MSKQWAYGALVDPDTKWSPQRLADLQGRLLCLELVWQPNRGAVFGVGHGQTSLFVVFTVLALALLTWLFVDSRRKQIWLQLSLASVVAGALGNLYDRVRFAHVRDFLRFSFRADWASWGGPGSYIWPFVFNVADVFITLGVTGLFLVWLVAVIRHARRKTA